MISWDSLVWPALGLVVSVLSGAGLAAWREFRAQRSVPAVGAGRRVSIPVVVDADRPHRGHAIRDGEDVRVLAGPHHLLVDRSAFSSSGIRRGAFNDELLEYAELTGLVDDTGHRYFVGPSEEWAPAFQATLEAPSRAAGPLWRLWAGTSRTAVAVAVAALLLGGVFHAIWWSGHDVSARMVKVVAGEDGDYCGVAWRDAGRAKYAELDCYEPYPKPGEPVRIRALAWPFDESALDYEGIFEFFTLAPTGAAAVALLAAGGLGARRLRRPAVRLQAGPQSRDPELATPASAEAAEGMPFRRLVAAVAAQEDWAGDGAASPPASRWFDPLLMAVGSARWLPALVLAGVAWIPESLPQPWRLALSAGACVFLLWAVARSAVTFLAVRRPFQESVTSEWDYQLVRIPDGDWAVLLVLGDTPRWSVLLASDDHPAVTGRCGVRGDLQEGGAIHLRIGGEFWVPGSPVIAVDDEFLGEIREDLVDRLVGQTAGDSGTDTRNTVSP